ncbi:NAD(P)H-binding protein [Hymenobacter lapidiphilus]|uniref:NAD(P)H-binding protein n=1 Tax=Hymenobacter lapidiphilus TaxID=2608003 RepID=A0A7Y7PQL3_9BACT|nr:NAD(P)H-binding protein [Hymenobacter lapidiphilus]NVO32256.1 NAD(P)H-binding protein [Hymenobacter lapidiphilus]
MKNVLLLNTGVVGRLLAPQLARAGHRVRVLTRTATPHPEWDALGIEQAEADMTTSELPRAVFQGVSRFFWVMPVVEQFAEVAEAVLRQARAAGVPYIVRHSEGGADQPRIRLSRWHAEADRQLAESGLAYTILRPTSFMQNLFRDHQQSICHDQLLRAATGNGRQAFVDAADVADAAATVLTTEGHAGKTYALTGNRAYSWFEVANLLTLLLGCRVAFQPLSDEQVAAQLQEAGVPRWLQEAIQGFNQEIRTGGVVDRVRPDLGRLLGRPPKELGAFLLEHAEAFQPVNPFATTPLLTRS